MVEIRKITRIDLTYQGSKQGKFWQIYSQLPNGLGWMTRFPVVTFDHLIGAYGMPDDITHLIDVAMHSPHIPSWVEPHLFEQDAAWQAGMITTCPIDLPRIPAGEKQPVHLYNAQTIHDARWAHMLRIASVKSRLIYDVQGARKVLEPIYSTPHITSIGVEEHREVTRRNRLYFFGLKKDYLGQHEKPKVPQVEDKEAYLRRARAVQEDFAPITLKVNGNRVVL